ncbi:MAG: pyrroline-5-carboxylate reductase [Roseivirga sp.]|nr:pyrroline-5-carboxylate reductase [Roseivirga sp.]
MKISIIGAGNLGLAIAKGILAAENLGVDALYLTKRNTKSLEAWSEGYNNVSVTSDNHKAVTASDVVIFAVQPGQLTDMLMDLKSSLKASQHTIISTITGKKIADFEAILGQDFAVIRSMPNTASAVSQSMTCISGNRKAETKLELAKEILATLGDVMVIEESLMQAATVVCASGIAFWMRLIRATTQGAIQLGFDAPEAQHMAVQTCLGAASLLQNGGGHPESEIDRVTTPKGCTIEGLNEMEHQGLSSALIKGLVTSFNKIEDIKKTS